MPNFNEQAWLEGFVNEAAAMGLDKQAAQELLKTAVRHEMMDSNPAFAEGFQKELEKLSMDKEAIAWLPLLGLMAAGGAGTLGLKELFDRMRTHWDRGPKEQAALSQMRQNMWNMDPYELSSRLAQQGAADWAQRGQALYGGQGYSPLANPQQWGSLMFQRPMGYRLG